MSSDTGQETLRIKLVQAICFKPGITGHIEQFEALERLIAAEVAKGQIAELERKMTLHVELLSSKDFKAGFSEALDQIDAANAIRIKHLQSLAGQDEGADHEL